MKIFYYENYKDIFTDLQGSQLTDALIVKAAGEFGIDDEDVHVIRDHRNKPYLAPRSRYRLSVSVSHCMNTFACIISHSNCGIDIQNPKKTDIGKIAGRFFSIGEQKLVDEGGTDTFYRLWTMKEAYAKFTGRGIGEVLAGTDVTQLQNVLFTEYRLDNGMYCAVCMPREETK